MSTEITCPTCGTVTYLPELSRHADAFCRVCDHPLFWTRSGRVAASGEGGDVGLRRLPGTAGRVALATMACPQCTEPNPLARTICIRCGADLHPAPPPPPPPPAPEPVPEPPPPPSPPPPEVRRWWPWVVAGAAGLVALVLLVVLLVV